MSKISADNSYNLEINQNKLNQKVEIIIQKIETIEEPILNIERKINIIYHIYDKFSKYIISPLKYITNRFK